MANPGTVSPRDQLANLFSHLSGRRVDAPDKRDALHTSTYYQYVLERYNLTEQTLDEAIDSSDALRMKLNDAAASYRTELLQDPENDPENIDAQAHIYAMTDWLETLEKDRTEKGDDALRYHPDYTALYTYMQEERIAMPKPVPPKPPAKPVAKTPIELVVEPRLQGMPGNRLKAWASLDEDDIHALEPASIAAEVEYYIRSPKPLPQYAQIMNHFGKVNGPDGTDWHQYRLRSDMLRLAAEQGYTEQVPLRKYNAQRDDMSLFKPEQASRLGMYLVRFTERDPGTRQKNTIGLVVSGHNGEVTQNLEYAGLKPRNDDKGDLGYRMRTMQVQGGDDSSSIALVHPIPPALVPSIARAHGMGEQKFSTIANLFLEYDKNPGIFAPPQAPQTRAAASPASPEQKVASPAPLDEASPAALDEATLQLLLQAYGARITSRRMASGSLDYALTLDAQADWGRVHPEQASELKSIARAPSSLSNPLQALLGVAVHGRTIGGQYQFDLTPRVVEESLETLTALVGEPEAPQPYQLSARGVHISGNSARFAGATQNLRARPTGPAKLQQQQWERQKNRTVHYYLMQEADTPMLVAVYHRRHFDNASAAANKLFGRFGLNNPAIEPQVAPLLSDDGTPSYDDSIRIPLHPDVFADLHAQGQFPLLAATTADSMVRELGTMVSQSELPLHANFVTRNPQSNLTPGFHEKVLSLEVRAARMLIQLETAVQKQAERGSDFFIVQRREGDNVVPMAYVILRGKDVDTLRKELKDVRLDNVEVASTRFTRGSKRKAVSAVEIRLTPEIYETLKAYDAAQCEMLADRTSLLLSSHIPLPEGEEPVPEGDRAIEAGIIDRDISNQVHKLYSSRIEEESRPSRQKISVLDTLVTLASSPQARRVSVKLPPAPMYEQALATLRAELAAKEKEFGSVSREHTVLKAYIAGSVLLNPGSQHAGKALDSASMVSKHATETLEHMREEIAQLEKFAALADNPGLLHGIVLRGTHGQPISMKKLAESLHHPQTTQEHLLDPELRLVDAQSIALGRGRKDDKRANLFLASPALWAQLEPALPEKLASLSATALPYETLRDSVGEHYEPHRYKPAITEAREVQDAMRKLGTQALVLHEGHFKKTSTAWREGDQQGQPHLYMMVDRHNRREALALIHTLGAFGGIDGRKIEAEVQTRVTTHATLIAFRDRAEALQGAQNVAIATDENIRRHIRTLLSPDASTENRAFAAEYLQDLIENPALQLSAGAHGELRTYLRKELLPRLDKNIATLRETMLPKLDKIARRLQLDSALRAEELAGVSELQPLLKGDREAIEQQFADALEADPSLKAGLGETPDVWSLDGYEHTVEESVAGRTQPQLTLRQNGEDLLLDWENDPTAREAVEAALDQQLKQGPLVLSLPLTALASTALGPLRAAHGNGMTQQVWEKMPEKQAPGRREAERHARLLDTLATSNQSQPRREILRHFCAHFDLPGEPAAERTR